MLGARELPDVLGVTWSVAFDWWLEERGFCASRGSKPGYLPPDSVRASLARRSRGAPGHVFLWRPRALEMWLTLAKLSSHLSLAPVRQACLVLA